MNELMWLKRGHLLPCKDADWVPYINGAWKELGNECGFSIDVVHNIWKELTKDLDNSKWLDGWVSTMSLTMDKSPNGIDPESLTFSMLF